MDTVERVPRNAQASRAMARRLVRRIGAEREKWASNDGARLATDKAWRAGVYEGLRLAQAEIRRGC